MSKVKDHLVRELRSRPRVVTRVALWKIPHRTGGDTLSFKIGRYARPKVFGGDEEPETLEPKSELTLDDEEFQALIEFLQENYEPFREGLYSSQEAVFAPNSPADPGSLCTSRFCSTRRLYSRQRRYPRRVGGGTRGCKAAPGYRRFRADVGRQFG